MIAISWHGLPQYAARLIRAFCRQANDEVVVVGVRPVVPVCGMEEILESPIIWTDADLPEISWGSLGLPVPSVFVQCGWAFPTFVALGKEVRRSGGKIIGLCDNNWHGGIQQLIGSVAFRLRQRSFFDAMLVPGVSARKLMLFYGMPKGRVACGLYGADSKLFMVKNALETRPKQFVFVGQFIERKGIKVLLAAFSRLRHDYPDWTLHLCGCGPLRSSVDGRAGVTVENFVQPGDLPAIYAQSRFLVLPSIQENWGLVVHEAALCGCALLLSDAVGSTPDLASEANSIIFRRGSEDALLDAMRHAVGWCALRYRQAQNASVDLASHFGPQAFASALQDLIGRIV